MRLTGVTPVAVLALAACQPGTTRPTLTPLPEAAVTEVRLPVPDATQELAIVLRADSLPARRVELRDGYLETAWLDSATGRPTQRRPIGQGVVRIRAWADPARPGNTQLSVETSYRPYADPSLPDRELDRQAPPDHPIAIRVRAALEKLIKEFGGPPSPEAQAPATGSPPETDDTDR